MPFDQPHRREFITLFGSALSGAGSSDESVLNEALKRGGLRWGDATVVYLGFPQHPAALVNGAIHAGLTSEPALTNALKTGAAALFARIGQFYPDQQSATVIYGASFLKSKRDAAKKFMRAYIRGARFYNDAMVNGAAVEIVRDEFREHLAAGAAALPAARLLLPPYGELGFGGGRDHATAARAVARAMLAEAFDADGTTA